MNTLMRAKMQVVAVVEQTASQAVKMIPVCGKEPFGPNGESEDNTFARYSPSGSLELTIANPALQGKIKEGQKFYVDFTEAAE
jgi:hypothetical protein